MTSSTILEAFEIGRMFGAFKALDGVTTAFREGQLTAVIGPNGAGKSTFFNILSGALRPTRGRLMFRGEDIGAKPHHAFAHLGIARSYQITNFFPRLTVHENVRAAAQARLSSFNIWTSRSRFPGLDARADAALEATGLLDFRARGASSLAHGQQRALEIAIALVSDPSLLLLDEPTAGMGPEETREMITLLERLAADRTILIVEHKMKMILGLSERILVLHHGKLIADGTPSAIQKDAEVRRVYLGRSDGYA